MGPVSGLGLVPMPTPTSNTGMGLCSAGHLPVSCSGVFGPCAGALMAYDTLPFVLSTADRTLGFVARPQYLHAICVKDVMSTLHAKV